MLKREGFQFQVCKNPDVKCSITERVHRTMHDKLNKYCNYKNKYRYIEVLPKFVEGYNATVHSSTGMPPANITDSDVLAIWKRMQTKQSRVHTKRTKYRVEQHVRISNEETKFAKGAEQNYTTEIFRFIKVIHSTPRPVYELEDLKKKVIHGQFYKN
jgi:hypothetical protein